MADDPPRAVEEVAGEHDVAAGRVLLVSPERVAGVPHEEAEGQEGPRFTTKRALGRREFQSRS
jgi:hypothetical protein